MLFKGIKIKRFIKFPNDQSVRNKVQIKEKDVYLCIIEAKEDAFGVCSGSGIEQNQYKL